MAEGEMGNSHGIAHPVLIVQGGVHHLRDRVAVVFLLECGHDGVQIVVDGGDRAPSPDLLRD